MKNPKRESVHTYYCHGCRDEKYMSNWEMMSDSLNSADVFDPPIDLLHGPYSVGAGLVSAKRQKYSCEVKLNGEDQSQVLCIQACNGLERAPLACQNYTCQPACHPGEVGGCDQTNHCIVVLSSIMLQNFRVVAIVAVSCELHHQL